MKYNLISGNLEGIKEAIKVCLLQTCIQAILPWPSMDSFYQFSLRQRRREMDNFAPLNNNDVNNNNGLERNRAEVEEDPERRRVIEDVSRELARIGDSLDAMFTSIFDFQRAG